MAQASHIQSQKRLIMNVNVLTQVLRQRHHADSSRYKLRKHDDVINDEQLVYKDVAGFIIFLVVAFSLLTVVMFG
jgi:hypothetical protein